MEDSTIAHRFALLEAQVKLLSDQAGLACPPFASAGVVGAAGGQSAPATSQPLDEVIALKRAGKTTQAVVAYRRLTGATMLEALRAVEGI